jgi:tRNA-Thr(GGU) m(6)t(6)A37 methyltransferase TsaA
MPTEAEYAQDVSITSLEYFKQDKLFQFAPQWIRSTVATEKTMFRPDALSPIKPIGTIHTPFKQAQGTPIQSSVANGAEGTIQLLPEFESGLKDLEGFDRLWLIYLFDRASEPQLIVRPYLDPAEHGIFATRSPARPNKIGMSPVRLLGIQGNLLHIGDVDMLDGTPLLDIKPYVPAFDHFTIQRAGWYKDKSTAGAVADDRFKQKGPGEPEVVLRAFPRQAKLLLLRHSHQS